MRNRLFGLAAAMSFLLLVLVAAAWVQSYRYDIGLARSEAVAARKWGRIDAFGFASGRFIYLTSDAHHPGAQEDVAPRWHWVDGRRDAHLLQVQFSDQAVDGVGFGWESGQHALFLGPTDFYRQLAVPCWCAAALCSLLPAWWGLGAYRRWRRANSGCCLACGYDLRATPGRCPECGSAAAAA